VSWEDANGIQYRAVTPSIVVTLAATVIFIAVEFAFFVGYLRRRGHQAPSAVAGRSNAALELLWALLPALLLAALVALTFQAAEGSSPDRPAAVFAHEGGNGQ
jgi:heme/copper-type cytochrome/quinol oxidase subunit 2